MRDYTSSAPVFSSAIKIVETTDPVHADNANAAAIQLIQNDLVLAAVFDSALIDAAFGKFFSSLGAVVADAMTEMEVLDALNRTWDGETSDNPNALSSEEVAQALETEWNGETSADLNALTSEEIAGIVT